MRRQLLLFAIAGLLLLGLWRPWQRDARLATDLRRDLFLDGTHVELLEGFEPGEQLVVWPDQPRPNLDQDHVEIVPFPRNGRLLWHVGARPGRFSARAARLLAGPAGDATPCTLSVSIVGAGPAGTVQVELPPVAADAARPAHRIEEGPQTAFSLALPEGAATLEIRISSPGAPPAGSWVTLLSPRVVHDAPQRVQVVELPLVYDEEQRLGSAWAAQAAAGATPAEAGGGGGGPGADARVPFASVTAEGQAAHELSLPALEVVGTFTGRRGRLALAFTGAARCALRVDIAADSRLTGAVALDDRMPPGARGLLVARVEGHEVGRVEVSGLDWEAVSWSLGGHAGRGKQLELELQPLELPQAPVVRPENDYVRAVVVPTTYVARALRIGFAEAAIVRPVSVPRRLASPQHPSVILVQVETLRADVLSPYGADPAFTPNLARLAERATVYDQAIAPSPWTLPSTATLFTGLPPTAHGVVSESRAVLPDGVTTLAERARASGIVTAGFVTNTLLRADSGFARGFGTWAMLPYCNARQVNDFAETFLANHVGQQFLLFLHYFDPHSPMAAPQAWADRHVEPELRGRDPFAAEQSVVERVRAGVAVPENDPDVRYLRQRYLGEVQWFDAQLGVLLAAIDRLGLADSTALVLTADHGEEFMEHGLLGHGSNLHVETMRVPLLVAGPGALAGFATGTPPAVRGQRVPEVVGNGGLFGEVLERLGVPFAADSLLQPDLESQGFAFIETNKGLQLDGRGDPLRRPLLALRSDTHMLVLSLPAEGALEQETAACLYDLRADPQERQPLQAVGREAQWHRSELERVLAWIDAHAVQAPGEGIDAERMEHLRALGYLGGGTSGAGPCIER